MRILVADDDPETCLLVRTILEKAGHSVVEARDAFQAVMQAQRQAPNLILLDIRMPAGTGLGALAKLKTSLKTGVIPVVVLSGVTDPAVERDALAAGALKYLHKPVDERALLETVQLVADAAGL